MGKSLFEAAVERRVNKSYENGEKQGYENGVLASIHALMQSMSLTPEQAMTALRVPDTVRPMYRSQLA